MNGKECFAAHMHIPIFPFAVDQKVEGVQNRAIRRVLKWNHTESCAGILYGGKDI